MKKNQYLLQFKTILYLLSAFVLIRIIFSLVVFYWNVPQTDDFCFMARMHEYGFWGSIKWWYFNWQGRYMPQILTNIVLYQYNIFDNMLLYGLFLTVLFTFSIYQTIRNVLNRNGYTIKTYEKIIISVLSAAIFSLIVDFHTDTSTFYWINVSTMYYVGSAFFILGISELISHKKSITSYAILCFSFIYVGSSAEHFGVLVLGFLILFYILQNHIKFFDINYFNSKKLNLAIIACLASFLIMYFAPGNAARLSTNEHPSVSQGIKNVSTFINLFYFNRLSLHAGYLIFGFLFALYLGSYFIEKIHYEQKQIQKLLNVSFATLLYFIIGTIIIFGFLITYNPPSRAFIHISTFIVLFFCIFGFIIGLCSNTKQLPFVNQLTLFVVLVYGSTIIYKFKFNLNPTITYTISVRERINHIQANRNDSTSYIFIPKLSNSEKNILWDGEMASNKNDTNLFWINKCLNTAYGLSDNHFILVDSTIKK